MIRPTSRLALLAAAGLVALAGCSSSTPAPTPAPTAPVTSASPAALLIEAADATTQAGSAKVASTTSVRTGQFDTTIQANGVVNFAEQQVDLTMKMDLLGQNQEMAIIVDGTKSYIKMAMLGDKWIAAPMDELAGVNYADPTTSLDQLKDVADLQEAGTEDVNGAPATKYTGTIDIDKALTQAGLSEEQMAEVRKQLGKVDVKTADVAVWVDEEGRVVRADQKMSFDLGAAAPSGMDGQMDMTSSTTFSDFGVQTDITPPPADQVMNIDDIGDLDLPTPSS